MYDRPVKPQRARRSRKPQIAASASHARFRLDQAQYFDWRCWTAMLLAGTCPREKHEDPWIREAVGVMVPLGGDWTVPVPTAIQRAVLAALKFQRHDTILRAIVESSLLAQLSPQEIAARWHLPEPMLTAFQALCFNVQGSERVLLWKAQTAGNPRMSPMSASFGYVLRTHAAYRGREGLETALAVILRCTGESMLSGVPSSQSPQPIREFVTCLILAGTLLPDHPDTEVLQQRIREVTCGRMFQKEWDPRHDQVVLGFLAAAKIPAAVRKEIVRLRRRIGIGPTDSDPPAATIPEASAVESHP